VYGEPITSAHLNPDHPVSPSVMTYIETSLDET
jgi:hypothetical protein